MKTAVAAAYSATQSRARYGGVFRSELSLLVRNRDRSALDMAVDQNNRLRRLLIHSVATVPYYRALFRDCCVDPSTTNSVGELARLPFLERETIHERGSELWSDSRPARTIATHTSGTTGKGLHLIISRAGYQRSYACVWFHYSWAGVHRGDRIATLAGHPVADPNLLSPPFWVYDPLEHELLFSSAHLTRATLGAYADRLARYQPQLVRGFPSSIYAVALHLLEQGRTDIRPKAVYTSSETLLDFQREAIEEAFGCRAYSYYSNAERSAHVLQCIAGNFHVVVEAGIVEVIKPDGLSATTGESGEIICTSFVDDAMPLIRYRVGDTAVVGAASCSCGYQTPILSSIEGRVEDVVVTPDGRYVGRLDNAFKDATGVKEAQIIQEDVGRIVVSVVPRTAFTASDERRLESSLRLRLGPSIVIQFTVVDQIKREMNGKFRFVRSKVPSQRRELRRESTTVAGDSDVDR